LIKVYYASISYINSENNFSNSGDGEPPDTAAKFWRILNKKQEELYCSRSSSEVSPLSYLSYTMLGLGDTNYTNFCNFGKNLNDKITDLGAKL